MAGYIEREALVERLKKEECDCEWLWTILDIPAADVAPVHHGHWITQEGWTPDDYYYTCSICNEDFYMIVGIPSDNNYKFCPHCGARMNKTE